MIEKTIQDTYTTILDRHSISYIHIPNRSFSKRYRTPENLKYMPDIMFLYNGTFYMRELGIGSRNRWRKDKQLAKMKLWAKEGANIRMILSQDAALQDLQEIGLIT